MVAAPHPGRCALIDYILYYTEFPVVFIEVLRYTEGSIYEKETSACCMVGSAAHN